MMPRRLVLTGLAAALLEGLPLPFLWRPLWLLPWCCAVSFLLPPRRGALPVALGCLWWARGLGGGPGFSVMTALCAFALCGVCARLGARLLRPLPRCRDGLYLGLHLVLCGGLLVRGLPAGPSLMQMAAFWVSGWLSLLCFRLWWALLAPKKGVSKRISR